MDIASRFKEFDKANYFSRVDADHVLELHLGLDEQGRKAIELRANFTPRKVTGTASIEVNQYKKDEYNTIRFSLCDPNVSTLFYKFCEDLIEQTRTLNDKSEGYTAICNRFFQWKKLFISERNKFLSEIEIMGLIGELLFLSEKAKELGANEALKGWSGQELTHKDFSYNEEWHEVKSVSRGKQTVKISSLEQLDSDKTGELVVYFLEKMSEAYDGITLNKLVLQIADLFKDSESKDDYLAKVALHGYSFNSFYDSFVYEVSSVNKYRVDNKFPCLTRESVPKEIAKASYEIVLANISDFLIME